MKNHNFRIIIFVIALFISLGLLVGGYSLNGELVAKGTKKQLATICAGPVNIEKQGKVSMIYVQPGKVDNLQQTWNAMTKLIEKKTATGKYNIIIVDKRNQKLQNAFNELQPAIYEATANNTYIALQRELDQHLKDKNIKYGLYLDNERLYLQMEDGDYYLYQVIERVNIHDISQVEA